MIFDFASWPPEFSNEQIQSLAIRASKYALSSGLNYLPLLEPQPKIPSAAIHAPFTLLPSPFPRKQLEKAKRLQRAYNILYARITLDKEFLDRVLGAELGLGIVDPFIGRLWRGWKATRTTATQPLHLGLFRSDYLLHLEPGKGKEPTIKQVEFNSCCVAFGGLAPKVSDLHHFLYSATNFFEKCPHLKLEDFLENNSAAGLAEGLAQAHRAYGVDRAQILFVVQQDERNLFDQLCIEYELLEKYSIKVIWSTFDELESLASVDPRSSILTIKSDINPLGNVEISTIYYRTGYAPSDYGNEAHYNTRFLLERSRAIKCPTIALQLAGSKKVQVELTQPGVLEYFLSNEEKYDKEVSKEEISELRETFMEMWGLDVGKDMVTTDAEAIASGKENAGVQRAREEAMSLVLKPQREGGGNNIYKEDIPATLDRLTPQERKAWIAMRLIQPPESGNYLVRVGSTIKAETISELGIFGWALFGYKNGRVAVEQKEVGTLLRTKVKESNEGGVAAGYSVLDSVLLVD